MARSGFWLRGARGKFQGAVLQKGENGSTIMRGFTNPTNPRTTGQMITRVAFSTVTKAAERMLSIIGISHEGVTSIKENRRRFNSNNIQLLRQCAARMAKGGATCAAFAPKGNQQLIPNSYIISSGSLRVPTPLVPKIDSDSGASFTGNEFAIIGLLGTLDPGQYTCADLWFRLFGLLPGDQVTFPQIYGEGQAQALFDEMAINVIDLTRFTDFVAPRLVLLPAEEMGVTAVTVSEAGEVDAAALRACLKTGIDLERSWYDGDQFLDLIESAAENSRASITIDAPYEVAFGINNDDMLMAIGCILSRIDPDTSKWKYSTSQLVCAWSGTITDQGYFGFTLNNAILSYMASSDGAGNFLQQGTDTNIMPRGSFI